MIIERKIIFRRTILDIPLILFIVGQLISTILSIDQYTSVFGYYSRFHGGFLSTTSYSLLYWAFVSNIKAKQTVKLFIPLMASSVLVSVYAVLQHFGIDKDIWVQDVQRRVFSTFGQPNWLAAWLAAIIPLTWVLAVKREKKRYLWIAISTLLTFALFYTKSRSALLGLITAFLVFWGFGYFFTRNKKNIKRSFNKVFLAIGFIVAALVVTVGTPWTPSANQILLKSDKEASSMPEVGTVLERGGTASSEIRKIVWEGAIDIWKNYPLFGSGVETFAYSYYNFRPESHNLVSEWDYLYNKAHNEYLNFLATTGTIGLITYLVLIGAIFAQIAKNIKKDNALIHLSLIAGLSSIVITNFFGFSVVSVAHLIFLFPAMSVGLMIKEEGDQKKQIINSTKIVLLSILAILTTYLLFTTFKYWYADTLYAEGKKLNDSKDYALARSYLTKAVNLSSLNSVYYDELSQSATGLALNSFDLGDTESAKLFAEHAINETEKAISLSLFNMNTRRNNASMYIRLAEIDSGFLIIASESLSKAVILAPTDAKLFYNLGLTQARSGQIDEAIITFNETVRLKPNYRDPRFALALLYIEKAEFEKAKVQLTYIIENINPEDILAKQQLDELR